MPKRLFALICALLALVACTEPVATIRQGEPCVCDACPTVAATPTGTVDVEIVAETPEPAAAVKEEWTKADPTELVGKWRAESGEPLPTFELVANEEGSNTPMNFDIRDRRPANIGCGLYPETGTVFCRTAEKVTDPPAPKATEMKATFARSGERLQVFLSDGERFHHVSTFVRDGAK